MPDVLIAAIARTADEAELRNTLSQCAGLDTSRITLFMKDRLHEVPARLRMHFIPFRGSALSGGSDGTNVPGMRSTLAMGAYLDDVSGTNQLKNLGIASDAAHYYDVAIDEGRSVVTCVASVENAKLIEEQFRARGFVKIRRFPWAENAVATTSEAELV